MKGIPKALRLQQQDVLTLLQRVESIMASRVRLDGVREDHVFIGEVTFLQRDTNARDVIFQMPDNADFVAQRFSVFPFFRFTTTDEDANGKPEGSFRPCIFSSTPGAFNDIFARDNAAVDCSITLSEAACDSSRALSSTPVPVSMLNCAPHNYRPVEVASTALGRLPSYFPGFSFGGGLVFPGEGYALSRGSSLNVRISPAFANDRVDPDADGADVTQQNEYRLVVTLEGYKVIK